MISKADSDGGNIDIDSSDVNCPVRVLAARFGVVLT